MVMLDECSGKVDVFSNLASMLCPHKICGWGCAQIFVRQE